MGCLVGLLLALCIFLAEISLICLLPSGFTIDHPSDLGILRKEFSKLKLIKTYLRSSIQQERLNVLAIMSIESEISMRIELVQNSEGHC